MPRNSDPVDAVRCYCGEWVAVPHAECQANAPYRLRVLDLFAGTGSSSRAFEDRGHDVFRVELDPKFEADLTADVRDVTPSTVLAAIGRPDVILAGPPCTSFSVGSFRHHWHAATSCVRCGGEVHRAAYETWACTGCDNPKPGDLTYTPKSDTGRLGIELLRHTLHLIDALEPRWFVIENPRALMRKMPELAHLERRTITHCQYGDPRRMKPTDLWGGFPAFFEARACRNGATCHEAAPRGARTGTQGLSSKDAAMWPPLLSEELCDAIESEAEVIQAA